MKPIEPTTKYASDKTLRLRYAELLRLREYVQWLERSSSHDTAERRAIINDTNLNWPPTCFSLSGED
jgi:hypothetical protein